MAANGRLSQNTNATLSFTIDRSTCPAVEQSPGLVGGARIFRGTRVPVAAFANLEDGAQVSEFVQWFPGVSLEQARAVLEHAAQRAR